MHSILTADSSLSPIKIRSEIRDHLWPNFPDESFSKLSAAPRSRPHFQTSFSARNRKSLLSPSFGSQDFVRFNGCDPLARLCNRRSKSFTVEFLNERDLIAQLDATRFDLLVTPYGSAFPKRAWPALLKYLRAGGNWLNIGGVPLSRPVVREALDGESNRPKRLITNDSASLTHL